MEPASIEAFDTWIRGRFRDLNTALEERYIALDDPIDVDGVAPELTGALLEEGQALIAEVAALPLLAPRRRSRLRPPRQRRPLPRRSATPRADEPRPRGALALPRRERARAAARHRSRRRAAVRDGARRTSRTSRSGGVYKRFTWLEDELLFTEYNCFAILAYVRAADVLRRVPPLGVTHPVAVTLFRDARRALEDVVRTNDELDARLDVERFFFNVRPYFKPYRVGRQVYRGANAGDFAAINEIDLMLGLCRVGDPAYAGLVLEKMPFMTVDDQRAAAGVRSDAAQPDGRAASSSSPLGRSPSRSSSASARSSRCATRTRAPRRSTTTSSWRGSSSSRRPVSPSRSSAQITASGPPLPVLLDALEVLRDKRIAADRAPTSRRATPTSRGFAPPRGSRSRRGQRPRALRSQSRSGRPRRSRAPSAVSRSAGAAGGRALHREAHLALRAQREGGGWWETWVPPARLRVALAQPKRARGSEPVGSLPRSTLR